MLLRNDRSHGTPDYSLIDGSENAPAGTAQYPTLLNGYGSGGIRSKSNGSQPPWNVAGVDYACGIPSGTSLSDPNGLSISGVTVNKCVANGGATSNSIGNYLAVTGNNVVISGYDFSLHGGWQIDVTGNNCTIENCKFKAQSTAQTPILFDTTAIGGTLQYCEIDGNNGTQTLASSSGMVVIIGNGG